MLLKKTLAKLICFSLFIFPIVNHQAQNWTWIKGNNIPFYNGNNGYYSSIGVTSASNNPRARGESVTFVDQDGNLWLFGGDYIDRIVDSWPYLNDLWRFNTANKTWTWIKGSSTPDDPGNYGIQGVPDANNNPPARFGASGWVDKDGNFWIFGGITIDSSGNRIASNDLWKYDIQNNVWTWIKGSNFQEQHGEYGTIGIDDVNNNPGARYNALSLTDLDGNFWLFGGRGYDKDGNRGYLNDLWKFNTASYSWVWVHGTSLRQQNGIYGTSGISDKKNMPGARQKSAGWVDNLGNLWLFGGDGMHEQGISNFLEDLWKYNMLKGEWTWISGAKDGFSFPNYGDKPEIPNKPGGRSRTATWKDSQGNFWFYGGYGLDKDRGWGELSDLWTLNVDTKNWMWIGGNKTIKESPVYGEQGIESKTNTPGCRTDSPTWVDKNGYFWLFGGFGDTDDNGSKIYNDLWKLRLSGYPNAVESDNDIPTNFSLSQNYPNPFNPRTTIKYQLPKAGIVTLKVNDILGREVAKLVNENKPVGFYEVNFDASRLTSGVYIYTIQAGKYTESKKMILMK